MEEQLVKKIVYETLLAGNMHPIQFLSEQLQVSDRDVATIRFAQGEVYFHHKDFEAAIFKWEKVKNELEPWAKRNIADAYFELGLFDKAEEMYKSVTTDNITLNIEVGLQLFSLYHKQNKFDAAFNVIKNCISLNPDYPNVTMIARIFYEEQQDKKSALDLAVNEAIRTLSLEWFDTLNLYICKDYAEGISPDYFSDILTVLYYVDQPRFEEITSSLWNYYKNQHQLLPWLKVFNQIFSQIKINKHTTWDILISHYQETYQHLMKSGYFLKELSGIMPAFLANWLKISDFNQGLFVSSAVLAWSEVFPTNIDQEIVSEAETRICQSKEIGDYLTNCYMLLDEILDWAIRNDLTLGNRFKWWIQELSDMNVYHLLVAGKKESGKSAIINAILGKDLLSTSTSTVVMFKDGFDIDITEIKDTEINKISSLQDFDYIANESQIEEKLIDFKLPSEFLREHKLALIDTPELNQGWSRFLELADSLLYVLNTSESSIESDFETLLQICDDAPNIPIHVFLNRSQNSYSQPEKIEEIRLKITESLSNAHVYMFENYGIQKELSNFIKDHFDSRNIEKQRISKLLLFIRKTIMSLSEKRTEAENGLIESIHLDGQMVEKLKGAINQIHDLEKEKIQSILKVYQETKDKIKNDLKTNIPKLLKECAELIKEDSDFRRIHHVLNKEMNNRVQNYIQDTILPAFYHSLGDWILFSQSEFQQSSTYLEEMRESFNALYGYERIKFMCDFKVLEDWQRDADRMTNRIQIEKVNILYRYTPSIVLLKSAGKLFGGFTQNKTMLYNKYKKYIENENFDDIAESIIKKFFAQFELFEQALQRDITIFFRNPLQVLKDTIEETNLEIKENQETLSKMKENPEIYQDPLNIFEVRLRQLELINNVMQKNSPYPFYQL